MSKEKYIMLSGAILIVIAALVFRRGYASQGHVMCAVGACILVIGLILEPKDFLKKVSDNSDSGIKVSTYELMKHATFKQIFDSLPYDRAALCFLNIAAEEDTCAKAWDFSEKNKDIFQQGWNHFLLKQGNHFFVAYVFVSRNDGLIHDVLVNRFRYHGRMWRATVGSHIVIPFQPCEFTRLSR